MCYTLAGGQSKFRVALAAAARINGIEDAKWSIKFLKGLFYSTTLRKCVRSDLRLIGSIRDAARVGMHNATSHTPKVDHFLLFDLC